ncbi:hypothetical protein CROQUDRAFT_329228 [Cronartium quercuum f. sp. fusiforme G11]|uniref:Uncharacterized protein n=1 Tax=Cronartium quercuum f. sp. fusiforme G11 TaxID=708437 RepID=A0A9P6NLM7_9BASI|nr:hypothetical protein CROQUDRAFT_329228 [Cronartium quercuum f. sp. fusiforme G11]
MSDLRAPAAGSGFAITLPNTTLGTLTYNATNSAGFFNSSNLSLTESASLAASSRSFNSTHDGQFVSGLHHNLTHNLTLASNTTGLNQTEVNRTNNSPVALPSAPPAFVPVSTLFVNPASPDISAPTYTSNTTNDTPKPTKPESPAPFPATWPRYIVPSNTPTSPPENTTLISILFSNSLNWPWLVTNSNASSQVLVFMPALVSTALHIDPSQVVTQSLQAYQPTSFNANNEGSMLTIWLGYIPNQYVDELQAMLKAPQSAFYNQDNPIYTALGKTIDSSLPITTFSSQAHAAQQAAAVSASSDQSSPAADSGQKMAVIASVTSCGAAILAIGLFLVARQSKQNLKRGGAAFPGAGTGRNLRPFQLSPNHRLQISSPVIGTLRHSAGHSQYYGQGTRRQSEPLAQLQSFPSFPSLTAGMSVMAQHGGHGEMAQPEVRYEYGHARTTSNELPLGSQQNSHSRVRVDSRSSWWRFNPEDVVEDPEMQQHTDSMRYDTSRSASSSPPFRPKIGLRRSYGTVGIETHQRPTNRRLQITRGADGLVSGIGRPVMKENSLFF